MKIPLIRNRIAMRAWMRGGAGKHRDCKRESKSKPVKEDLDATTNDER